MARKVKLMSDLNDATTAPEPNVYAGTPGEFAARWNAASEERRQAWMNAARDGQEAADRCLFDSHLDRIQRAEADQIAASKTAEHDGIVEVLNMLERRMTGRMTYTQLEALIESEFADVLVPALADAERDDLSLN